MKLVYVCLAALLLTTCMWSQTPAPEPQATPPAPAGHAHGMAAMHDQHMQEMKDQVAKMRATLDQMKANLAKIKTSADQKQEQMNIELWDAMIHHMEGMVEMMSHHGDMMGGGMGMMHGMGDMNGMHHGAMACGKDHHEGGAGGCCAGMAEMKDGGGCCGGSNKCSMMNKDGEKDKDDK